MPKKIRILIIGPRPPSVGGIASYIRDFTYNVKNIYNYKILFITVYVIKPLSIKALCLKIYSILFNVFKLISFVLKDDYDIAHIHTSSKFSFIENSVYILFLKAFSRRPVVLHIHAPDFDSFLQKTNIFSSIYIKYILNLCDSIIVLSNYWKMILNNIIKNNNKVIVIPNAANSNFCIDESQNRSKQKLNLPLDKKIIYSLGNLVERKGFSYLVDSISIVSKKRTDFLCVIGGSGSMKTLLESQINQLNLDKYIKFTGFVSDEELPYWFNSCDLFVLPSLAEGSPIVMFETLCFGKPFIGTNVGGIPDIITSDKYGYLVEPKNPEDLAEKILLSFDKQWNASIIKNYSKKFNWENIVPKIVDIYLKCLIDNRVFSKSDDENYTFNK